MDMLETVNNVAGIGFTDTFQQKHYSFLSNTHIICIIYSS
jgi:hypothetical protein